MKEVKEYTKKVFEDIKQLMRKDMNMEKYK